MMLFLRSSRSRRSAITVVLLMLVGCQSGNANETDLILTQTPPGVQAAFMDQHRGATIKQITRTTQANQDYYTFKFTGTDGNDRAVKMNEAGDVIENH